MYVIMLDENVIARVSGTEYAFEVFQKTKALAELLDVSCQLIEVSNWEIIADFE